MFGELRGVFCVNIGFPDDGTPAVGKERLRPWFLILSARIFGHTD
jgi:hypothetical protein